nr:ATP-dependent DNA ligase [Motilibacter deserti]
MLAAVAAASAEVAATRSRRAKVERIAAALTAATPAEAVVVAAYLAGELTQRRTGVGWASLRELPPPAQAPTLDVLEADRAWSAIAEVAGAGAQGERRRLLEALFARATEPEQRLLRGLALGELRQGALDALVVEGLARATDAPLAEVRRAVMLRGATPPVAEALLAEGSAALARFRLEVGRPVHPMLASTAADVAEALGKAGPAAVEEKLDGIRVQVHRRGDDIAVFTRTLDDVTSRLPEVVEAVRTLPADELVLDGEALALGADGRPRPFQETAARTGSRVDVPTARARAPLSAAFFDVLHVDGEDLLTASTAERHDRLAALAPEAMRVRRVVVTGPEDEHAAAAFSASALARGHEGVVVKALDAPYEAGRRGAAWLKVKPVHTLDLVVLAAEWGSGRRRGWLSNLHLGARGLDGGFVMLGKTFKGLTDAMLQWQTTALLELAVEQAGWGVVVRPELVVEIAFDGVQASTRYPAGMALRFARVIRHRPDKTAAEADTVDAVRAVFDRARATGESSG